MARTNPLNAPIFFPSPHYLVYDYEADTNPDGWADIHLAVTYHSIDQYRVFGDPYKFLDKDNVDTMANTDSIVSSIVQNKGLQHYSHSTNKKDICQAIWNYIEWCLSQPFATIDSTQYMALIAHNGGRYDHLFMFSYLVNYIFGKTDWKPDFHVCIGSSLKFLELSRVHKGHKQVVRFLDSIALFPSSLAQYGDLIGLPKLHRNAQENELLYCMRDCEILYKALATYQDIIRRNLELDISIFGNVKRAIFSGTQLSLAIWRALAQKTGDKYNIAQMLEPLDKKLYEGIEGEVTLGGQSHWYMSGMGLSTIGGMVAHGIRGYIPNCVGYDVTSMYPAIAAGCCGTPDLAWDNPHVWESPTVNDIDGLFRSGRRCFVMALVTIPPNTFYPPIPIKTDKTHRPTGDIITQGYIDWELLMIVREIDGTIEPISCISFDSAPVLQDFMGVMFNERMKAIAAKDEGRKFVFKILMNSLVGSFGTNKYPTSNTLEMTNRFGERVTAELSSAHIQPQVFTSITSRGQAIMAREIMESGKVIYVDTDGIKAFAGFKPKMFREGNNLGDMKHEFTGDLLVFGSKIYAIRESRTLASRIEPRLYEKYIANGAEPDVNILNIPCGAEFVVPDGSTWKMAIKALPVSMWQTEVMSDEQNKRYAYMHLGVFVAYCMGKLSPEFRQMSLFTALIQKMAKSIENSLANNETPALVDRLRQNKPIVLDKDGINIDEIWPWIERKQKQANEKASSTRIWPMILPDFLELFQHATLFPDVPLFEVGMPPVNELMLVNTFVPMCPRCKRNGSAHRDQIKVNYIDMYFCSTCNSIFKRCNTCDNCKANSSSDKRIPCITWGEHKQRWINTMERSLTQTYLQGLSFKTRMVSDLIDLEANY